MVRELHMGSPDSVSSQDGAADEPITPRTPAAFRPTSRGNRSETSGMHAGDDVTPKQAQRPTFNRQIEIPIPASFWYVADDPATHTLEYATKVSGRDYRGSLSEEGELEDPSLPATVSGSATENEDDGNLDRFIEPVEYTENGAQTVIRNELAKDQPEGLQG